MAGTGLFLAHAAVYSDKRVVPVQVLNVTDEPITLHRNKLLGFLHPMDFGQSVYNVDFDDTVPSAYHHHNEGINSVPLPDPPVHATPERWTKKDLFARLKLDNLDVKLSPEELSNFKDIIWKYRSTFSFDDHDLGRCNMYEAKLELKPGYKPSWVPPRPVAYKLEGEMERQIDGMLNAGIIEPCLSDSNWNSPIFLTKKKNGSYRFICDLRGLNEQILDDNFPLENLNHILDKVNGDCIFSTCDFSQSFFQVPYDRDSRPYTAFTYKNRRYQFCNMTMGNKTSSSKFTRMMTRLLANVPISHLFYFIDDLMLSSRDTRSHIRSIELLLQRLSQASLKLKPQKCEFLKREIQFVGYTVDAEGIRMNDDRVEAVRNLRPPRTVKETMKVLGFLNYNKKFCPNYSRITRPLYALLRKGQKFYWSEECQAAFDQVKEVICNSTNLCFPDTEDRFQSYHVCLDGSKYGYAATLSQLLPKRDSDGSPTDEYERRVHSGLP